MKLYIAEKPSLGRAIAAAVSDTIGKPPKECKSYIELANGDVVSWCIGHILEQANPEDYDDSLKKWSMDTLPIIPNQWQLKPISRTRSQLTVLRKLVKQADQIIHAGDPDREGQLLVDEVIDYLKVPKSKKNNTKRLLISDLNLPAVKRSLISLKNNSEFIPLSISALARARADWLYGINLTRAYTLQGKKQGFNSVLSVGRVQTPLLGLVVRREQEIKEFVSKPFYQVLAHLSVNEKSESERETFTAKWQPSESCQKYCDDEGRVLVKALALNVISRITNQDAIVENIITEDKQQSQPLPFNLSSLQIAAAKQFSMNAKLVLDVCQSLYEKHKLITYPRSDCRYLPKEQLKQASVIIDLLSKTNFPCAEQAKCADKNIRSKAWNDKKITAHHAIIPTEKSPKNIQLNPFEINIYLLIVRQYLIQFYPVYKYQQTVLTVNIAKGIFRTRDKVEIEMGWKKLFPIKKAQNIPKENVLPQLSKGQVIYSQKGELVEKQTSPPESFTDATLLSAMTGIARFVCEPSIKKVLKDTDGLGTDATRAGIIDLLFKRNYLQRESKKIVATEIGIALINALPVASTQPDMTAQWESTLTAISEKKSTYLNFMEPLINTVTTMVEGSNNQPFTGLPKVEFKPKRKKRKFTKKETRKNKALV